MVGTGLTVGNLDVLVQQHKGLTDKNVTKESIQNKWGKILRQLGQIITWFARWVIVNLRNLTVSTSKKLTSFILADLGLPMQQLDEIIQAGNFDDEFNFDFFTGVACLNLGGSVSTSKNG